MPGGRGWALVTGAARRIGRTLALTAARAGYDVVVHHHDTGAEETAAEIAALGRRAVIVSADLADAADCRRLIAEAPAPLTLLVNSASLFEDDLIQTLTPEAWDAAQAVNIRAPVLLSQAFAAALPPGEAGQIVNIIDQRVLRLTPQFFSYAVSKAALWAATQMLAQGLAPRIRVNAIAPGPTLASVHQSPADFAAEAGAVPLGHGPTPEEIGQALAYLIDAPSVTGQMIAVDGGQHLSWKTPDIVG
ncbi:MAG TPA: SDR family oxidoreductase [Caulobacteraceae bacterium]|jgi:NAD(P)-dependent dehydrogenase (short-subunit alcohol dehydrogenase family)|nr:SDR family oxidoreductase [Caulobacteraceae bacterium]